MKPLAGGDFSARKLTTRWTCLFAGYFPWMIVRVDMAADVGSFRFFLKIYRDFLLTVIMTVGKRLSIYRQHEGAKFDRQAYPIIGPGRGQRYSGSLKSPATGEATEAEFRGLMYVLQNIGSSSRKQLCHL